jgi:hypothetical protein
MYLLWHGFVGLPIIFDSVFAHNYLNRQSRGAGA